MAAPLRCDSGRTEVSRHRLIVYTDNQIRRGKITYPNIYSIQIVMRHYRVVDSSLNRLYIRTLIRRRLKHLNQLAANELLQRAHHDHRPASSDSDVELIEQSVDDPLALQPSVGTVNKADAKTSTHLQVASDGAKK